MRKKAIPPKNLWIFIKTSKARHWFQLPKPQLPMTTLWKSANVINFKFLLICSMRGKHSCRFASFVALQTHGHFYFREFWRFLTKSRFPLFDCFPELLFKDSWSSQIHSYSQKHVWLRNYKNLFADKLCIILQNG